MDKSGLELYQCEKQIGGKMKSLLSMTLLVFFVSCSTLSVNEEKLSLKKEVANYTEMKNDVESIAKDYSGKNILVVFDIDYTMLQNTIGLGSEAWFYWQESLLGKKSSEKVSDSFDGLLRVQGLLYDIDPMKLTDENLDEVVASFQKQNMKTIVLTSRGFEFRSATERALKSHGLDFNKAKIGEDIGGTFIPYDVSKLSTKEKEFAKNKEGRLVSYSNGVFMTAGQHKGLMLRSLLKRFDYTPDVIFFVDNHEKQTNRMFEAFDGEKNVVVYRYSGMDKTYKGFNSKRADRDWKKLKKSLESIYKVSIP